MCDNILSLKNYITFDFILLRCIIILAINMFLKKQAASIQLASIIVINIQFSIKRLDLDQQFL